MATKTDRIFELLPSTFAVGPGASPLGVLVRTYGGELQGAENALAAAMRAHWIDQADRGAAGIDDLERMAALYGLAPRPDDSIEEFRERLKLWVRLILEGPATVRGLLRATSVILGVAIDDRDEAFDAWWLRAEEPLTTVEPDGRDAASLILGVTTAVAIGIAAKSARLLGRVRLTGPLDLSTTGLLHVDLDDAGTVMIDLVNGALDPARVPVERVVGRINAELGAVVAEFGDERLTLTSPTTGATSRIIIADGADDSAYRLLGLPPGLVRGSAAAAARYQSPVDLSAGVDLSGKRFLRLQVDGTRLAEIDCAGPSPASTSLDQVQDAINAALGAVIASHDGTSLSLTSPTTGVGSTIVFLAPAAQDATKTLFGPHPTVIVGADARPATHVGRADLSRGVDLRTVFNLTLSRDGDAPVTINCAGENPASTQLPELVNRINTRAPGAAQHNGHNLILKGRIVGVTGTLLVGRAQHQDANETLLGLPPRWAIGAEAQPARISGTVDLSGGKDLSARSLLRLAVDYAPPQLINLTSGVAEAAAMNADDLAVVINSALGVIVASNDGGTLALQSPSAGAGVAAHIAVERVEKLRRRRFVSRMAIVEDAALSVLGVSAAEATGKTAISARIAGEANLSRGVDLRGGRFLRLAVDGAPAIDIDCAGPRPRTTTVEEVVERINTAFDFELATVNDAHLLLTSPSTGTSSQLTLHVPRATDALERVLGIEPTTVRGRAPGRVSFAGTVDLSAGVDLSVASFLKLAVDGAAAVEVDCAGALPATTTLGQIAIAINIAMGVNIASHDGKHVLLTSPSVGGASSLEILPPAGADASGQILGIASGRSYRGESGAAAELTGTADLSGPVDLRVARFLRLSVDAADPLDIDCAEGAVDPSAATATEVSSAINAAAGVTVASEQSGRLTLRSPSAGLSSKLTLEPTRAGDARVALLGNVSGAAAGTAAQAATLIGTVDLRRGVDLGQRSVLPVAAGSRRSLHIDIGGVVRSSTAADEILGAINAELPGMASLTAEGFLRLTAVGDVVDRLVVPALRHFELSEYAPQIERVSAPTRLHGQRLQARNDGAAAAHGRFSIAAPKGASSPGLLNLASGWQMRLLGALQPDQRLEFEAQANGSMSARYRLPQGATETVAGRRLIVAPKTSLLRWPHEFTRRLGRDADGRRRLTLSDDSSPEQVLLTQRGSSAGIEIKVQAAAAIPTAPRTENPNSTVLTGRLSQHSGGLALRDASNSVIARLKLAPDRSHARLLGAVVVVVGSPVEEVLPAIARTLRVFELLDVEVVQHSEDGGASTTEQYAGVALAEPEPLRTLSLIWRVNIGPTPSLLVRAELLSPADALRVGRGSNEWFYLDCLGSRFDLSHFDQAHFAGEQCLEQGIFDVSRFAETPRAATTPVFARLPEPLSQPAAVAVSWSSHQPSRATVNLPADLSPRYGARFNTDRFALPMDAPERFSPVVTEPAVDTNFLVTRVNDPITGSVLVGARLLASVPIGFEAVQIPFANPRFLVGGRSDRPARLFLAEEGIGGFVEIAAKDNGAYGDRISVLVCDLAPGQFDLQIAFQGARFENARAITLGPPLTGSTEDLLQPGPRGLLHLKAGGVSIAATRDRTPDASC